MEYNNKLADIAKREGGVDKDTLVAFVSMLAPFAPHIGEELWEQLGQTGSVFSKENPWPVYDEAKMVENEVEIAVQINGKTKAVVKLAKDIAKEDAIAVGKQALGDKLSGNIIKEIYVPGRIINIVAK
jgi:leucyl-tRNA synthetase